jgi:hypothetical protein
MTDATSPNDRDRSGAELEKLRLEIERLKIEISGSRRGRALDSIVRLTPLITVTIAVFGVLFTVYQYKEEQKNNRIAQQQQLEKETRERADREQRDAVLAQREFMKPLLEKQQQLYFEASSAAAIIASTNNPEERRRAELTFWKLYWGPLVFVESTEVSGAMKNFGNCLSRVEDCDETEMKNRSLKLGSAMEESILNTWKAKPEDFNQNQFKYR